MIYQLEINCGRGWEIHSNLSADAVRQTLATKLNEGGADWVLYSQKNLRRHLYTCVSRFASQTLKDLA